MNELVLGKVSPTPRGEYNPDVMYEQLDIISYNGSSYIVRKNCTGVTPVEGPYYMLLSSRGSDGVVDMSAVQKLVDEVNAAKQNKLTGTTGQLVGFNTDGAATPVRGFSNPNLFDNWYFANPVNQKGITQFPEGWSASIDRWWMGGPGELLEGKGIYLPEQHHLNQRFDEHTLEYLNGKELTFSALSDKGLTYGTAVFQYPNDVQYFAIMETGHLVFTVDCFRIHSAEATYIAAKLELGTEQTLAHQDVDGNWVLNDPPPNKALEVEKCMRYFERIQYIGPMITSTSTGFWRYYIPFKVAKRTVPTVTLISANGESGKISYRHGTNEWTDVDAITSCTNHGCIIESYKMPANLQDGALFSIIVDANL